MLSMRCGSFKIPGRMFHEDCDMLAVKQILSGLVIINADHEFHSDAISYTAYGECFDPLHKGQEIPYYDIEFELGQFKRFVRRK